LVASRFSSLVVCADLAILAVVVFFLRDTFAHKIGVAGRVFDVSKPLMMMVVWLTIAVPVTIFVSLVRRFVQR
jgi:hypothetical protein